MADKEYIEREATKKMFLDDYNFDAATAIDTIPTADVVEITRCKDCDNWCEEMKVGRPEYGNVTAPCSVWSNEDGYICCTKPTDFCSYGERKE